MAGWDRVQTSITRREAREGDFVVRLLEPHELQGIAAAFRALGRHVIVIPDERTLIVRREAPAAEVEEPALAATSS